LQFREMITSGKFSVQKPKKKKTMFVLAFCKMEISKFLKI